MKKMVLFGGSGGIGKNLLSYLQQNYDVYSLSSKDVDIIDKQQTDIFFRENDIDIVINASGYNFDSFLHKLNNKERMEEIKKQIDVNIIGNLNILSCCLPKMRENKYGRIILISSVLSYKTIPGTAVYSSCKSFIDTLVRICSSENIMMGITCNSIQLGYFGVGMWDKISLEIQEKIIDSIGLRRCGKIEELYQTIQYLINTEYITGTNIKVSGGE